MTLFLIICISLVASSYALLILQTWQNSRLPFNGVSLYLAAFLCHPFFQAWQQQD